METQTNVNREVLVTAGDKWRYPCSYPDPFNFFFNTFLTKSMYLSHLPCIESPSMYWVTFHVLSHLPCVESPSMYWVTFHVLSHLPCIWVTFHVSELPSMYPRYLPCIWDTFHVSEIPSMYLRYLPCIWVTFHVSTSSVCQLQPVAQSIETSMTKNVFLWCRFQRDAHLFSKFRLTFTWT